MLLGEQNKCKYSGIIENTVCQYHSSRGVHRRCCSSNRQRVVPIVHDGVWSSTGRGTVVATAAASSSSADRMEVERFDSFHTFRTCTRRACYDLHSSFYVDCNALMQATTCFGVCVGILCWWWICIRCAEFI